MSDSSSSTCLRPRPRRAIAAIRRWPRILLCVAGACLLCFSSPPAQPSSGFARQPKPLCPNSTATSIWPPSPRPSSAPVIVRRDAHGVPHIDAATQDDLFVAQGYVTAQDRLWQMDASRRAANGNLAEILGPRWSPTTRRSACCKFASPPSASTTILPAADRARPRRLRPRREPLHLRSAKNPTRFRRNSGCSATIRSPGPAWTPSAWV